ncbi:hypothetical protein GCM10023191_042080 [Actinoallomurus oryzae]|uniref:Uncharacterized protein n=1 Tax=Actinoallomurus oryzae TaxID=502180 RepID=A0ABP8Q5C7_9ACTN
MRESSEESALQCQPAQKPTSNVIVALGTEPATANVLFTTAPAGPSILPVDIDAEPAQPGPTGHRPPRVRDTLKAVVCDDRAEHPAGRVPRLEGRHLNLAPRPRVGIDAEHRAAGGLELPGLLGPAPSREGTPSGADAVNKVVTTVIADVVQRRLL